MPAVLTVALTILVAVSGPAGAQPNFRIGVVLPLTGPLAVEGQAALGAIVDELRRANLAFEVRDDRGAPEGAVQAFDELLFKARTDVVIGPLTTANTEAMVGKRDLRGTVVMSLAILSRDATLRLGKSSPAVVTFSSVPPAQLRALEQFGKGLSARRVSLVSFSQAGAVYADEVAAPLGAMLPRQEAPLRSPLSRPEDVFAFIAQAEKSRVDLILGTVLDPIADELVKQLRQSESRASLIVFSPPGTTQRARMAARLVAAAGAQRAATSQDVLAFVQRSPLWDRDFRNISLNWRITEFRSTFSKTAMKPSTETHSCTCNSTDGLVFRQCDCLKDEKCDIVQARDTCKVGCKR